jgi:hypothetical protein
MLGAQPSAAPIPAIPDLRAARLCPAAACETISLGNNRRCGTIVDAASRFFLIMFSIRLLELFASLFSEAFLRT